MNRFGLSFFTFLVIGIMMAPSCVFADSPLPVKEVLSGLSSEDINLLLSGEEITRFTMGEFIPELAPDTPLGRETVQTAATANLTVGTEALFLYRSSTEDQEGLLLKCYNILGAVSTLEGIEYWSASRKRMRVLFEESWVIDKENDKVHLPDPVVTEIPVRRTLWLHQKDSTFGSATNRMDFRSEKNEISAVIINMTPLYYGIIKVIEPEAMQMHILIIPVQEGILFYGIAAGKTLNMKVFEKKAQRSFYNRIKALYSWFSASLNS